MQIYIRCLRNLPGSKSFSSHHYVFYTDLLSDVFTLIDKYYITASNHITHISHTLATPNIILLM